MQYCPACFNQTLSLSPKGVIDILINGKQMDAGRFLFNIVDGREEMLVNDLTKKIEEFFKWYSNFQNPQPIYVVELLTAHVNCDNNCPFSPSQRFSVVGVLIKREQVTSILKTLGEKYKMEIELKEDTL